MFNKFRCLSAFEIKLIAVVAMVLDHLRVAFPDTFPLWFRVVGRLAFPLFAYLIADGFRHTRSPGKFLARLAAFAVISEPFFDLVMWGGTSWRDIDFFRNTSIFYALFLGGAAITLYRYTRERWRGAWVAVAIGAVFGVLGIVLGVDYGWVGVVFIFALYAAGENRRLPVLAGMCFTLWLPLFIVIISGYEMADPVMNYAFIAATFLAVPVAACYNGKRGPDGPALKWFFYAFYPVHLAVLAGVMGFIN